MRLIDADEMAANESEAYMSEQTKIDSPITLAINSCVHRKIQQLIADTLTIDPESLRPVGRWQKKPGCTYTAYECNVCHNFAIAGGTEYCPHCGAKMEE